jgi:hypothetical protein
MLACTEHNSGLSRSNIETKQINLHLSQETTISFTNIEAGLFFS